MKSQGGEKTRIQPLRETTLEWRLVSALFPMLVTLLLILVGVVVGGAAVGAVGAEKALSPCPSS